MLKINTTIPDTAKNSVNGLKRIVFHKNIRIITDDLYLCTEQTDVSNYSIIVFDFKHKILFYLFTKKNHFLSANWGKYTEGVIKVCHSQPL